MVENEVKFVLRHEDAFRELMARQFGLHVISQGYLNENARLRKEQAPGNRIGGLQHVFTYKQRLSNGENFEINADITEHDFNEVWPLTDHRLEKDRASVVVNRIRWDIDFYRWSQPYFVLAESEMPSGMVRPDHILPVISERIVYEVPRDDSRFTARRLSDEDHVMRLAVELGLLYP